MTSDSENYKENVEENNLEQIVYSLLGGEITIEELKERLVDCDKCPDSLEEIIQDCLKNRVERKCCPDKVVNELRLKIGYTSLIVLGFLTNLESFIYL